MDTKKGEEENYSEKKQRIDKGQMCHCHRHKKSLQARKYQGFPTLKRTII